MGHSVCWCASSVECVSPMSILFVHLKVNKIQTNVGASLTSCRCTFFMKRYGNSEFSLCFSESCV